MNTKTIFKSLLAIGVSFNLTGLALDAAPITGEVHTNSTFADSPEDLKKAYELLLEGDTQSLLQMTNEDKCAPVAKPIKVIVDELKGDYIRWHVAGHADLPCYSRPKDITVFINGHAVNGSPTPSKDEQFDQAWRNRFGYGS
jgi:hypothetical protein